MAAAGTAGLVAAGLVAAGLFARGVGAGPPSARAAESGSDGVLVGALAPDLGPVIRAARPLGALPPSRLLHLSIGLRQRHVGELGRLLDDGRQVGALEYERRFGPSPAQVAALQKWFSSRGLSSRWSPGSASLEVSGPAKDVEQAFSVRLGRYRVAGPGASPLIFYAPDRQPLLPAMAARVVTSVLGLDNFEQYRATYRAPGGGRAPVQTASASQCGSSTPQAVGGFTPKEVSGFYNFQPLYSAGLDGEGQTVVFMEIDGYQTSDLRSFADAFGLPPFEISGPVANSAWGTNAPIAFSGCSSETELDLEVVHALAPAARLVIYDSAGNTGDVTAALQAAVNAYPHAIFNLSLGGCEIPAVARQTEAIFTQLNAHGGTAFVSSGDSGAYVKSCPSHNLTVQQPASSPNATAVGGTTAFLGSGDTYGQEAIWGEPYEQWGAGGGVSAVFPRPSWQKGPGVLNRFSDGMREVPDVAAIADGNTGWDIYSGGGWGMVGGTSAAAPLWAALAALTNQALVKRGLSQLGFVNPAIYDIGANPAHFPAPAFHPVTAGNNLYYQATSSAWNYGVGWGTPNGGAVVDDFIAYQKGKR